MSFELLKRVQRLTLGELHAICYTLGVDYDTLRGENSQAKARRLFTHMKSQERLGELERALQARPPRRGQERSRVRLLRWNPVFGAAALLLVVAAIAVAASLLGRDGGGERSSGAATRQARQQEAATMPSPVPPTPGPPPTFPFADPWTISYADAAGWLETLPPEDREDQIRDWAMWGLAQRLDFDIKTLRNVFYDQPMVRNAAFDDLAVQRVGPGRGLADGRGNLHVLAPAAGPGTSRAIGMVLDDYRKDAGIDPDYVLIYRYEIEDEAQQVVLYPEELGLVEVIRQNHGYREMRVDNPDGLQRFLDGTQHLSRLQIRDGQLWAGGWTWPDAPAGRITAQDLTVLQRGYRYAALGLSEPGFSLDPGESLTVAQVFEILDLARYPKVSRYRDELAVFVTELSQAETELEQARILKAHRPVVQEFMNDGDHAQLLRLLIAAAKGDSPYQRARYDGGLQGTEAGMTYFYTDLVAKAWPMEKGTGVPTGLVPGFISHLAADIPWGHCTFEDERGRLWFGLREESISIHDARIDLGSITTRVFTRIEDPRGEGQEIEPSYKFGRMVWWWDRHYLEMADYEPQYHRLDQLMRWGAAIAWLVETDVVLLPELSETEVKDDWRFGEWLSAHPELRWHFDIPFVQPPGETTEALLTLYSEPFEQCGREWIRSGGISNPDIEQIVLIEASRPELGPEIARAGLGEAGTTYSPAAQAGTLTNRPGTLVRTLAPIEGDFAYVATVADGRRVWSLGSNKLWVSEAAQRTTGFEFASQAGRISQSLSIQGFPLGELSAAGEATLTSVHWQPGALDRAQRFFASLQEALPGRSLLDAIAVAGDVPAVRKEPGSNRVLVQLCAVDEPCWFAVEKGLPAANGEIAFRLGVPSGLEGAVWYTAYPHRSVE